MRTDKGRFAAILALTGFACALGGCQDNLARRDSIASWAGDDLAANEAIQTINPWPREAFDQRQVVQGSKVEDAMKIYRLPPAAPSAAPSTSTVATSAAGPVAGEAGAGSD